VPGAAARAYVRARFLVGLRCRRLQRPRGHSFRKYGVPHPAGRYVAWQVRPNGARD